MAAMHAIKIADRHDSATAGGGNVGKMFDAMQHSLNSSDAPKEMVVGQVSNLPPISSPTMAGWETCPTANDDYGRPGIIWVGSCGGQCPRKQGRFHIPGGLYEPMAITQRAADQLRAISRESNETSGLKMMYSVTSGTAEREATVGIRSWACFQIAIIVATASSRCPFSLRA